MKKKYLADFYSGGIFHVYSRTNNKEPLFRCDENNQYFLRQYVKYLDSFLDTFCWNLLPNHFHFLVRVKSEDVLIKELQNLPEDELKSVERKFLSGLATVELLIEFEWRRFLTSYAMAFNNHYNRKGNLLHRPFKRVEVNKESHFTQTIIYIHANAQRHKLCIDFRNHKWSSWHMMVSNRSTLVCRNEILNWFGGMERFIEIHKISIRYNYNFDAEMGEE